MTNIDRIDAVTPRLDGIVRMDGSDSLWFRWVEIPGAVFGDDPGIINGHTHAADHWRPWHRGESAARAMTRRFRRVNRQQARRELRSIGYVDLGDSGGG
jgi:hypothetical protein